MKNIKTIMIIVVLFCTSVAYAKPSKSTVCNAFCNPESISVDCSIDISDCPDGE